MDPKMLVLPAMLFFGRKIDFTNPEVVKMGQISLVSVGVLLLTLHYYVYTRIQAKKSDKQVWVPPKPKPTLPFGLGPPEEPLKKSDFVEQNFTELETNLLKESAQAILMSLGISLFMSFQFKVHMPLAMQSVMLPLTAYDSLVIKKYLFGVNKHKDGHDRVYGELSAAPTDAALAIINKQRAEASAAAGGSTTSTETAPVATTTTTESTTSAETKSSSEKSTDGKTAKKSTPAADLD